MSDVKRVLVTGVGSAIGREIARQTVAAGYVVDFAYHRTPLADGIAAEGSDGALGDGFLCDLSDAASVRTLAEKAAARRYHAFVHNAGVSYDTLVAHADLDRARVLMEVNFWSFVALCKAVVPAMSRSREGRIVAIGSVAAWRGRRGNAIYSASKAALSGFVRSLAAEIASRGVTANVVSPGPIKAGMLEKYDGDMGGMTPLKRLGRPDEVAAMVRYLLSPEAGFVTGAEHVIDGGLSSCLEK